MEKDIKKLNEKIEKLRQKYISEEYSYDSDIKLTNILHMLRDILSEYISNINRIWIANTNVVIVLNLENETCISILYNCKKTQDSLKNIIESKLPQHFIEYDEYDYQNEQLTLEKGLKLLLRNIIDEEYSGLGEMVNDIKLIRQIQNDYINKRDDYFERYIEC